MYEAMRFYRVHLMEDSGVSAGFEWFISENKARKRAKSWEGVKSTMSATVESVDIELTEDGVLTALNKYASHNDNG
jgi:hypothetical protein